MSAIFGWCARDDQPVPPAPIEHFQSAFARCPDAVVDARVEGSCGLGRALIASTPEDLMDRMPVWLPGPRVLVAAEARLDDRPDLCAQLSLSPSVQSQYSDAELVALAFERWGEASAARLLGDWSFAAWTPAERRLLIARDVLGVTQLFFHCTPRVFAFASSFRAMAACPGVPPGLDELHLGHVLTSWPREGDSTIRADIKRVGSGEVITVTPERFARRRYWDWGSVTPIRFSSDDQYVEGFREVFSRAVGDRLRAIGPVSTTLSGGLDSGAVTTEAARLLAAAERPLLAFSHVPLFTGSLAAPTGDERWAVTLTANAAALSDHTFLNSAAVSPMSAIREALQLHAMPLVAAANQFWLIDLMQSARRRGAVAILVGQAGNETISWRGTADPSAGMTAVERWGRRLWRAARSARKRVTARSMWSHYSPIHPAFAARLNLPSLMRDDGHSPTLGPPSIEPGRLRVTRLNSMDATMADKGIGMGVSIRDPTCDRRMVAYCLAIPPSQFSTPQGERRWLIRRAMRGRMPDAVLDQRGRGRQAADFGRRLRDEAEAVEHMLAMFEKDALVSAYLDVGLLRTVWRTCRTSSAPDFTQMGSVLARGLMAGLYLQSGSVVEQPAPF